MDLICSFAVFILAMILSLSTGVSMILPLVVGVCAFALVARRRGFRPGEIAGMFLRGAKESAVVVVVMVLIGCLTSLWRQTGTIAYFTYYGIQLIPPQIFILAAFLLAAVMSYALGTSFGVAGTIGVILMTIARASGVSPALVGGAIMSGIYVGDRGSPAASSASLVANETRTEVSENIRLMLKTSILPLGVCVALYAFLSMFSRPGSIDTALLDRFAGEFRLSAWCLLPTVLLLAPAFAGMKIRNVMIINIAVSILLAAVLQKTPVAEVLRMMVLGYAPRNTELAGILSGGGIASMLEVVCILLISSGCAGIFEGTKMLSTLEGALESLCGRIGRFPTMAIAGLGVSIVFCNQTIGIIMCRQCMGGNYADTPEGRTELMLDIENSVVTICGLVPWCIACSVPLKMLGCDVRSLPFAAYLYLIPLCWLLQQRRRGKASH